MAHAIPQIRSLGALRSPFSLRPGQIYYHTHKAKKKENGEERKKMLQSPGQARNQTK